MVTVSRRAAFFAVAFVLTGSSGSFAASPITDAFLANLQANVSFLDHSSEVAAERSGNDAVRKFARAEAVEQIQLASALNNLMPLIASTEAAVLSGRSVAIDGQLPQGMSPQGTVTQQAANGRAALAPADLENLAKLSGRAFDDMYWQKQLDALSQIEADYRAYIATGDDPVLVTMAKAELPKIVHRLELLSKI